MSFASPARTRARRVLTGAVAFALLATLMIASSPARAELTVTVNLDKVTYLSGDDATATAVVYRTPGPTNYTYSWQVSQLFGGVLLSVLNGNATLDYEIPLDFEGTLVFRATVDDGTDEVSNSRQANVALAYMSLILNRADFNPGEIIVASYSVSSHVITSPRYDYEVEDSAGTVVLSGNTTGTSFSFPTPNPASPSYLFRVTAVQGTNSTSIADVILQASGMVLAVTLDRPSYAPGETIGIHLRMTARGSTVFPSQFRWVISLGPGGSPVTATTTRPEVDLSIPIPQSIGNGDLVLIVQEQYTATTAFVAVRIGPSNPVWATEIAGIPVFALFLTLLFVLLLIAFAALWRRVGLGRRGAPMEAPGEAPPPPPEAPRHAATSPMSVACTNCGKAIDITTSKRPIEVMCPSCGETQLVT